MVPDDQTVSAICKPLQGTHMICVCWVVVYIPKSEQWSGHVCSAHGCGWLSFFEEETEPRQDWFIQNKVHVLSLKGFKYTIINAIIQIRIQLFIF